MSRPIRVGIIGTGNIGTDLAIRILKDSRFQLVIAVGRRADSPGLLQIAEQVPRISVDGLESSREWFNEVDGFFDATSAFDHKQHWKMLEDASKWVIDLTPSKIGKPLVPELSTINQEMKLQPRRSANYSMVTCGGQSSAPLIQAFYDCSSDIKEVEISSSIASLSAGPATRRNIDQYISSTENLSKVITNGIPAKAILVLNPAEPPVMMRTTVTIATQSCNVDKAFKQMSLIESRIQKYVPGYEIIVKPHYASKGVVSATAKVTGAGHFLPSYAGNLDIINAAAVETAARHESQFNV